MNLSLTLFVIGFILIVYGYMNQLNPSCNKRTVTKIISRNLYDSILKNAPMSARKKYKELSANAVTDRITY